MLIQQMLIPSTTFILTDMGKRFVFGFVIHTDNANTPTDSKREPVIHSFARQHFLYFLPLPHGHGSLRPVLGSARM